MSERAISLTQRERESHERSRHAREPTTLSTVEKLVSGKPRIRGHTFPVKQLGSSASSGLLRKELCEFVRQARTLAATDFSFKIEEAFNGQPVSKMQSGGESGFNRVVPFCVSLPDQAPRKKLIGCFFALNDPPGTRNRGTTRTDRKYTKSLSSWVPSGGTRE